MAFACLACLCLPLAYSVIQHKHFRFTPLPPLCWWQTVVHDGGFPRLNVSRCALCRCCLCVRAVFLINCSIAGCLLTLDLLLVFSVQPSAQCLGHTAKVRRTQPCPNRHPLKYTLPEVPYLHTKSSACTTKFPGGKQAAIHRVSQKSPSG